MSFVHLFFDMLFCFTPLFLPLSVFSLHKRTFTAGGKTNGAKSLSNVRVQIYEYRKRKRNEKRNGMKRKRCHLNNKPTNILDSLRSGGDIALYVYKMAFYNREDAGRKTQDGRRSCCDSRLYEISLFAPFIWVKLPVVRGMRHSEAFLTGRLIGEL